MEDLVQATCERALTRRHLFTSDINLERWLETILRSIWIDELRRREARAIIDALPRADGLVAIDAEAEVESRLSLSAAYCSVRSLSSKQRAVLLLVSIEELSYRQVASVLRCPVGTVMSRLSRARKIVRSAVEGFSTNSQPNSIYGS